MPAVPSSIADEIAVGAASATFATTMIPGSQYQITSTTAAWVAVGSAPTAVGRAIGNMYIAPNYPVNILCVGTATKVAIIQDAAVGFASLALFV